MKRIHAITISICAVCAFLVVQARAQSYTLDGIFTGGVGDSLSNNFVSAVQPDGKILVGGDNQFANGIRRPYLSRFNADGSLDISFNLTGSGPNAAVWDILVLSNGKIVIAGRFTAYNGTSVGELERLNSDGTLDTTFNPGGSGANSSGLVRSIALQADGRIIAGGDGVTSYNGVANQGLFRINADGTLDSTFVSRFAAPPSIEQVLIQSDGKILIGTDDPAVYGGSNVGTLMRINADASLDIAFTTGLGPDGRIFGIAVQPDGKIIIGGSFFGYNGTSRPSLARLNADGTIDNAFVPTIPTPGGGLNDFDSIVVQPDGKVLVSGSAFLPASPFFEFQFIALRLNADGSPDTSFNIVGDGYGYHISLQGDGKVILTGNFTQFLSGEKRLGIARINANGTVDSSFNASFTTFGAVYALVQQEDGKILAAGRFTTANGIVSYNIARFDRDGTVDTTFDTRLGVPNGLFYPESPVKAFAMQGDGKILAGGSFGWFNSGDKKLLVRLNHDGTADQSLTLSGDLDFNGPSRFIQDIIVLSDGKILVGGGIFQLSTGLKQGLWRLNSGGSVDTTFNGGARGAHGSVLRIVSQPDGKFIIAGEFTFYNGVTRGRIARINSDGTLDMTFTTAAGANATVSDVALQSDGKILIAGNFTAYRGTPRARVARLNSDGTLDTSFNAGIGLDDQVRSLKLAPDGRVVIGGYFNNVNGVPRTRLAILRPNGSLDNALPPALQSRVSSFTGDLSVNSLLFQPDGKLLVGGAFTDYNGAPRNGLLRLAIRNSLFDYDADGKTDISVFRPSTGAWYLQQSTAGLYGTLFGFGTDKIAPADFDGDGKTDIAVYRPSTGIWYVFKSSTATVSYYQFGLAEDLPVPADYDGDGKADIAVFRPSTSTWYRQNSSDGSFYAIQFGSSGDKPTVGDFDGDGKADIAIFRPSVGAWYHINSSNGSLFGEQFGFGTDIIVPADYDGDGKTDLAVFRPSNGFWYIKNSATSTYTAYPFGLSADIPAPGDFDGDGKADLSVFRPSDGNWYRLNSSNGTFTSFPFGTNGDKPTQTAFRY